MRRHKCLFGDANNAFQCYFERRVTFKLTEIDRLVSGNIELNFLIDKWTDGFCGVKRQFTALNRKVELCLFEQLKEHFMIDMVHLK